MKIEFTRQQGEKRLILFFSGWASHPAALPPIAIDGYDTAIVYDYRMPEIDIAEVEGYDEIVVAAWSYGVAVATHFIESHPSLPITARIAINGTPYTVDERLGIPPGIFSATLENLNEVSLGKFYRRMCASNSESREFQHKMPQPDLRALSSELKSLGELPPGNPRVWDYAVVADTDFIIPPDNQTEAWETARVPHATVEGRHLLDFGRILTARLINKHHVLTRFGSSRDTYNEEASLQREVAGKLASLLPQAGSHTIEIGCGTGLLSASLKATHLTLVDLDTSCIAPRPGVTLVNADAELWIRKQPSETASCIVSASTIQWFNSPQQFVNEALRVLRPGGTLLLSTFGDATFREMAPWARRLPFLSEMQWRDVLPEGAMVQSELKTLTFGSVSAMLRHLSDTGVNALNTAAKAAASALAIMRHYPTEADGSCRLTYEPLIIKIIK